MVFGCRARAESFAFVRPTLLLTDNKRWFHFEGTNGSQQGGTECGGDEVLFYRTTTARERVIESPSRQIRLRYSRTCGGIFGKLCAESKLLVDELVANKKQAVIRKPTL